MKKKFDFKNNKKLLIGLISFAVIVIGAAYAYYSVTMNNYTLTSNILASGETPGTVTLVSEDSMYLQLTASNMSVFNEGSTFYAGSTAGASNTSPTSVTLAKAFTNGEGEMSCNYTMTVTRTSTNDIYDAYQAWLNSSKANEQIVLQFTDGTTTKTYDFNSQINFPLTINGTINNISKIKTGSIKGSFYVKNLEGLQQDFLANKSFNLDINFTSFNCTLQGSTPNSIMLKMMSRGLTPTTDDDYRYYGTGSKKCTYGTADHYFYIPEDSTCPSEGIVYDNAYVYPSMESFYHTTYENCGNLCSKEALTSSTLSPDRPSNFICFGTTNASTCKANVEKYMYRIIGAFNNEDGNKHLKLIKYKQLPGTYQVNTSSRVETDWEHSPLNIGLNGTYFLTNANYDYLQDSSWLNRIEDWRWRSYTTIGWSYDDYINLALYTGATIRFYENGSTSLYAKYLFNTAKIGLMNISDYALSSSLNARAYISEDEFNSLRNGWMLPQSNTFIGENIEYTIGLMGNVDAYYSTYVINNTGSIDAQFNSNPNGVRPVFYLKSSEDRKTINGSGTYTDPYVFAN